LHLDVNQQPGFLAVFAPDFEKLVGKSFANRGIASLATSDLTESSSGRPHRSQLESQRAED
jgi:hypothetical protein